MPTLRAVRRGDPPAGALRWVGRPAETDEDQHCEDNHDGKEKEAKRQSESVRWGGEAPWRTAAAAQRRQPQSVCRTRNVLQF